MSDNGTITTDIVRRKESEGPIILTGQTDQPHNSVFFDAIRRHKISFILVMAACVLGGGIYLMAKTPLYSGEVRLLIQQNAPRLISEDHGVMKESTNFLFAQAELIRSRPVLASAANMPAVAQSQTLRDVDAKYRVDHLKKIVSANVGLRDGIVKVRCLSPYTEDSATIANAVVEAYTACRAASMRISAGELLRILQREKAKKETELSVLLEKMVRFKQVNRTLSFQSDRGNITFQKLAQLSEMLTDEQMKLFNVRANYQMVRAVQDDPATLRYLIQSDQLIGIPASVGRTEENRLRSEFEQLDVELVARRQESTDESPAVRVLVDKIEKLKSQLHQQDVRVVNTCLATSDKLRTAAEQKYGKLEATFEIQRQLAEELNVQAARYAVLESQLKRSERGCDVLDSRIKELNVTENVGGLTVAVLESASPPRGAAKPNHAQVMALSGAIGLFLALGWVFIADWRDQRLRSVDEASATLGSRILGTLPSAPRSRKLPHKHGHNILLEPRSHTAEACRRIRTTLLCGQTDGPAKTILITSPQQGDGKSTFLSNLAIAMAQAGRKTLVIDADLRRPIQHKIFEVARYSGITNLLSGREHAETLVRHTAMEGLDILPCGPVVTNPSELLHNGAFANTLKELSGAYDFIFVDSPCVLPLADTQILTASCDRTVLVLRANKTTRKSARMAIDSLLSVGGRLLGIVVNDVPQSDGYYPKNGYEMAARNPTDSDWPDDTGGDGESRLVVLSILAVKGRNFVGEVWKGLGKAFQYVPRLKNRKPSRSA